MKEKIILAPGANGSELLRSLAKFGVNTMGVRVMSGVELAKYALMKSGISITEEFLTRKEEPSVIFSFLNEIDYFKAASYADAESLSAALCTMRGLVTGDERSEIAKCLDNGEFAEKNAAIKEVHSRYLKKCEEANKIDSIGLIRKAIAEANSWDAEFFTIREYALTPLETELVNVCSGDNYTETSLVELFGRSAKHFDTDNITQAYGSINEIENILAEIYRNDIPLDNCVIACTNTRNYSQIIYDITSQHNISTTYGTGLPIDNANPARLLKLMLNWCTSGYYGVDTLREIILSNAFDRSKFAELIGVDELKRKDIEELVTMAGQLRICDNSEINNSRIEAYRSNLKDEKLLLFLDWTEKLANELAEGISTFVNKFTLMRPEPIGRIDQSSMNVIMESLNAYMTYAPNGNICDIIPEILNKTVCSENSRQGCLHVTSISGAMSSMRQHLFVCGLSATEFPGSPSENYLLLDNDLLAFADEETAPTSSNRIANKKKTLDNLLNLAASLDVDVRLSYSAYSLSELKEQNPSSYLAAFDATEVEAPYFKSGISSAGRVGDEYSQGAAFKPNEINEELKSADGMLDRAWSPSALEIFFQCPRRFYLTKVLNIPEVETDDPFVVLTPAQVGTLAHSMMEALAANDVDRDTFVEMCDKAYDATLTARPPMHLSDAKYEKKVFLNMMRTAYDSDPHNKVLSAEEKYTIKHPSGVILHGYPDRVEQDEDGKFLIADFKTKRKIDHIEDDIDTCLQVVIYAWMCEQAGIDISRCEYRYLRKGLSVSCKYDDEMKNKLNDKLVAFKTAIENNDFPRNETPNSCKYCKMNDICNWESERKEAENE